MRYWTATTAALAVAAFAALPAKAELGGPKYVGNLCTYQNPMAPSGIYYLDKCPDEVKPVVHHHHTAAHHEHADAVQH